MTLSDYGWILAIGCWIFEIIANHRIKKKYTEAKWLLVDAINQACREGEGRVDSRALSSYADALRFLAQENLFEIEHETGRRIIGRWVDE